MRDRDSKPRYVPEIDRGVKSIVTRISLAEYASLRKLLHDDHLSIQSFLEACVVAYNRGDTGIMKMVEDHKRLTQVPKAEKSCHLLSQHERKALFDEIEQLEEDV